MTTDNALARSFRKEAPEAVLGAGWSLLETWRGGAYNRLLERLLRDVLIVYTEETAAAAIRKLRADWAGLRDTAHLPALPRLCMYEYTERRVCVLWRES